MFVEADSTRGLARRRGNVAIERRDGGYQGRAHRAQSFLHEVRYNGHKAGLPRKSRQLGKLSWEGSGKVSIDPHDMLRVLYRCELDDDRRRYLRIRIKAPI